MIDDEYDTTNIHSTSILLLLLLITTSGQSNLSKGRIALAHESFNLLQPENVSFKRFQH